jgi:hypothetical protein
MAEITRRWVSKGNLQRRDGIGFAGPASSRLLNDTDSTAEYILEKKIINDG